jgi:sec-independent protein translocase protein TatA
MLIALIGPLGLPELLIILAVLILIFGASRLSGLGRGLGQSIRGFTEERRKMDTDETPTDPRPDQRASR